jgi:NAD(P)-dependent dehydrogenase (short-subunit alcohol dehydrogenase family)
LVAAYRKLGYAVVANSRSVDSADPEVVAVALGIIRTPMHPADNHETLAGLHPLGRIGEIDDVVEAIVYLEQARFVTGGDLHVDGGQSAGHQPHPEQDPHDHHDGLRNDPA